MIEYWLVFGVVALLSLATLQKGAPAGAVYTVLFLMFVCVVGLRYASTDYFSYLRIYNDIDNLSQLGLFTYSISAATPVESGFALLVIAEKNLVGSFPFFVFAVALLSLSIKFAAFRKLSPYAVLSLLIYVANEYFFKELSQARNALASGIVLYCVLFVAQRNLVKFVVGIVFAALFHTAAIAALPLYWVGYVSSRLLMTIALSVATVLATLGGIGTLVATSVASLLGLGDTARLVKYLDDRFGEGIALFGGTMMLHLAMSSFLIIMQRRLVAVNPYNRYLIPMYVYGSAAMIAFIDYTTVNSRIRELFCISAAAVILPSVLLLFPPREERVLAYSAVLVYCTVLFIAFSADLGPYRSVLFM